MSSVRWLQMLVVMLAGLVPASALACTVTAKVPITVGPYSPAAVAAGKVSTINGLAGFSCGTGVLTLFGGNYLKGTFATQNASGGLLKLKNGTKEFAYTAFADAGSTVALTHGKQIDYMQNNLLNLLGVLGGSNAALPLYIKPGAAAGLVAGDYSDKITIAWDWQFCSIAYVLGACAGTLDKGTGTSEITVTVTVGPQDLTITLTSVTTWDPVKGTSSPLAFPGSKGRASIAVRNPDLVPLDDGSVAIVYKVPDKAAIVLDGDGSGSATTIGFVDGSPTSGLALTYSPTNAPDDVDFSSDNGASWSYAPTPGNRVSEGAVTQVRFRMRGAMKATSGFTVSIPYRVR